MVARARALGGLFLAALLVGACNPNDAGDSGKTCASDDDCKALVCVAEAPAGADDLAPLPLTCGKPRDARAPHEACERAEQCDLGVCLLAGACARPCDSDALCAESERCEPVYARGRGDALHTLHACVNVVDVPDGVHTSRELRKAALHGALDVIDLAKVADPTLIVLEHDDDSTWPLSQTSCRPPLCAPKLVTLDDTPVTLFDITKLSDDPAGPLNPVANGDHVSPTTVLLPNGPRSVLSAAGYAITLQSELPGDLRITRIHRASEGHRLDLNLFYVGAEELAASGDRGPPFIADALDEVDRILAQADIFLGEVRQVEVRGKLLERGADLPGVTGTDAPGFAVLHAKYGVYPELPELWKLSAGASNIAIDVFFVSDIEARNDGGDVGGISGGTPGPLGMHGTRGSGIAIATDMMIASGDPKRLGRTLAHELGHMLGLFHTSELRGLVYEPLPDTPACDLGRDTDGDGILSAAECSGAGADNLMFPTTEAASTLLSPDQCDVLRRAVVLQ